MIKMDALKKLFEELKFKNVVTYIQSGNVVFQYRDTVNTRLENIISKKIMDVFGFDVKVIVINEDELRKAVKNNPFVKIVKKYEAEKLYLIFLSSVPEKSEFEKINSADYEMDKFVLIDKYIYLLCGNGYGKTKLNNNFFENKLKVTATARNWKTVNELLNISGKISASNRNNPA